MWSFVFRKIINKRWMALCLLIGNLLMISIAAASPMYAQAVLQRALTQELNNYQVSRNAYPGTFYVRSQYSEKTATKVSEFGKVGDLLFQLDEELGLPAMVEVTQLSKGNTLAQPVVQIAGEDESMILKLACFSDLESHINIAHGSMYSNEVVDNNTIEVIVNERTMVESSLVLGKEMVMPYFTDEEGVPYRIRVVGMYEHTDAQDPYWMASPESMRQVVLMDEGLFREMIADPTKEDSTFSAEYQIVLDHTKMRADQSGNILDVVNTYSASFDKMGVKGIKILFQETMEEYMTEAQKLNTTITVLQIPVFVLLAAFMFMVSQQMLESEQNEIAVFKSRGACRRQIIEIYLLQSTMITAVGVVGGIPLGMMICKLIGASNDFLSFVSRTALPLEIGPKVWAFALGAGVVSVCTMVFPVIKYSGVTIVSYKRGKNRASKRTWWKLICLDLVLLAVSLYGWYQFNGQQDYLAQQVMSGASMDPMLYLSSSLFMLGAGLLFLRILPWVINLVFMAGKKWWPPAIYTSFLRIMRTKDNQGFLVVFLVLTIAMGIFNTQMARTINANSEERIRYVNGADVVVQEVWDSNKDSVANDETGLLKLTYEEPDFGKYLELDGIESVTKVLVDKDGSVSVEGGKIKNVTVMGIHTKEFGETAWFKESLLPTHWYHYLNALSKNSNGILVSSNVRDQYGYEVGDTLLYTNSSGNALRGVIYGFVDYWPGYSPVTRVVKDDGTIQETQNTLVVGHLSQMQADWGVQPYQVWMKLEGSSQFLYDYAAETGIQFAMFEDTNAQVIGLKNDPVFQGTNGILTIGFIVVLLLCAVGFLIYWILSIRSRTLQFGIFRAMGMSQAEVLSMLLNEQIFLSVTSIGAGVLVGRLCSKLFVPLIQIAYSAADRVIPLEIISETSDFVRLGGVIGAMIVVCVIILGILISKIRISQALKLGED